MQCHDFNSITQGVALRAGVNQPLPAGLDVFTGAVKTAFNLGCGAAFDLNSPVLPVGPGEQQVNLGTGVAAVETGLRPGRGDSQQAFDHMSLPTGAYDGV